MRFYFRKRGVKKAIALPGIPGSEEFMSAYQMALDGLPDIEKPEIGSARTLPGTVDSLCVSYYRSDWLSLAEETRRLRRPIIERFRERHGAKRFALLRPEHIVKMLANIGSVSAKRAWLKAIRHLFQHSVPAMLKDDPTAGIAMPKMPKTGGHHSWTDGELAQFRAYWPNGTQQRLVFEFAFEALSRRGEVVRLGPQHCYMEDGEPWIRIARTHRSKDVDIPVTPELQAAMAAMPKTHLTFIVTKSGKPRSKYALGNDFARWAREAGLPDHCRLHGLKKAGMTRRANAGDSAHKLMAASGHKTLAMVQRYTEAFDQKKLLKGTNPNAPVTTPAAPLHKPRANPLKLKR
jgi:integrase